MLRNLELQFAALLILIFCHGLAALGQDLLPTESATPEALAKQYIERFCSCTLLAKELQLKQNALERLRPTALSRAELVEGESPAVVDTKTANELASLLATNVGLLVDQVEGHTTEAQEQSIKQTKDDWLAVREQRNRWDLEQVELATAAAASTHKWLALLGRSSRWFWLCGAIALGALFFVSWHDRRHEYRRKLNGAKARAYGLTRLLRRLLYASILVALTAFFGGDYIIKLVAALGPDAALRTKASMSEELKEYDSEPLKAKLQEVGAKYEEQFKVWTLAEPDINLRKQWSRAEQQLSQSLMNATLLKAMVAELESDIEKVTALRARREQDQRAIANLLWHQWFVSGGVGTGITALLVVVGFSLAVATRKRERLNKVTCPMCLSTKSLEFLGTSSDDDSDNGSGIGRTIPTVRCNRVFPDGSSCNFEFEAFYHTMGKICFPTLGVRSAGKTLWLAMVYRELGLGSRSVKTAHFEKVRSQQSAAFDRMVRTITAPDQQGRGDTQGTQTSRLPFPLIFNFCDNDQWGKSNLLVNVFDYSGEVTHGALLANLQETQRQRALSSDGYIFFLDPTQPRQDQEEALSNFQTELRVLANVKANEELRVPVALCLTKIDLIGAYAEKISRSPIDTSNAALFYSDLQGIDPGGQTCNSLSILEKRSERTKQLCSQIWSGWDIEGAVFDLFGGRTMFFPLTPVGLADESASDWGVDGRTIEPFGIVEPLVWLLHMNGYPILVEK